MPTTATYREGQKVRLDYHGQQIEAAMLLVSPNMRSLMLAFEGALMLPSGGMILRRLPLLLDEDGVYRDLVESAPATLTVL